MACNFEVFAPAGRHPDTEALALEALDLVDSLEDRLSIYRESSELSELNRRAFSEPVVVSQPLLQLTAMGLRLHAETKGAFDLTSGPLSRAWGFHRRAGSLPDSQTLAEALARVGSDQVAICHASSSIQFTDEGIELNFNSLGKGYALDRCGSLLQSGGVADVLLHGGQSSVLALGNECLAEPTEVATGWRVGIPHPLRLGERLGNVRLKNQALATSGSGRQFFHHQGNRYGHILDPRTGQPVQGMLASTVIAPSAVEADALSTAFFVIGPEAAGEYCRQRPELGALLVTPGTRDGGIHVHSFGLDQDGDEWQCSA